MRRYTPERDELFMALGRVLLASPRQTSPDDPSWLELLEPGAEFDVDEATAAYQAMLESEKWCHDDSVHCARLWFEFGAWCVDQSKLATWGRLLLVRFGLDLGFITPEQMPLDIRAERSLEEDLARAIARMDPHDIDVLTCANLISRAREAVVKVDDVERAYRLVLLASKLAQWATALRQRDMRSEAEDIASEANHRAEFLSVPAAMRRKLRVCEQELDDAHELAGEPVGSRLGDVAALARSVAEWADMMGLAAIRDSAHSMAHEAETMVRERGPSVATHETSETGPEVEPDRPHERPKLSIVRDDDSASEPPTTQATDFENADTDRFVASLPRVTAPPSELADTQPREPQPPVRTIRRRVARGLVVVAAAAAMFMAGWMLHRPQASDDRVSLEVCMLPSTPENTHQLSATQPEPTRILIHDVMVTVKKVEHDAMIEKGGISQVVEDLPRTGPMTFHVEDASIPFTLRME